PKGLARFPAGDARTGSEPARAPSGDLHLLTVGDPSWSAVLCPARAPNKDHNGRLLLIDDLASVIAAGDAAQGGAERLGVDGSRKILDRVAAGTDAGSAQQRGNEVAIEVGQTRPEAACEFLRQGIIRMVGIFGRPADLVHVPNLVPRRPFARQA